MTDLAVEPALHSAAPFGSRPGAVIAVLVARKAVRSGAVWGLVFAVFIVAQIFAYTSSYPTQAARDQLENAFGTNIGINALIGPARAINTVAGFSSWRMVGILSLLGAIWGLLTSTRLLRGDEEAGRYDLLLAGRTTRRLACAQGLGGLGAGLFTLFVLTAIGATVTGRAAWVAFTVGESLYFAVTLVAGAAIFLAVGALTSQLANTRRRAASMAGVVFGISYALRMVADSDPSLHWLVWLSPLGWIEESRPLVDPQPLALLPALALIIVLVVTTVHLVGTRDVGAATLPGHDSSDPHLALVGNPIGLAVRLTRPVTLGWLFAVLALAVLIGTVAESATRDVKGIASVQQALGRLGGNGSLVAAYLGLTFLILATMLAMIAAGQIAAVRTEESEGRLETLVVRPVSRTSWLAGRVGFAALVLIVAGILAGIGAWAGAASQHTGMDSWSIVLAGVNIVPPALFLLGIGTLVFGIWPRLTSAVVYGYLTWSFLLEFIGAVVHANHWLLDTSIFFHMAPAPATDPNWTSAAVIVGLAAAAAAIGRFFLRRRDVMGA